MIHFRNFRYKLKIFFSIINYILVDIKSSEHFYVYIELNQPPFLLKKIPENPFYRKTRKFRLKPNLNLTKNDYQRVDCFGRIENFDENLLGYANGYRIEVRSKKLIYSLLKFGHECKTYFKNFSFYFGKIKSKLPICSRMEILIEMIDNFFPSDQFPLNYACRALFSKSYKIADSFVHNDLRNFLKQILEYSLYKPIITEECLFILKSYSKNRIIDYFKQFIIIYEQKIHKIEKKTLAETVGIIDRKNQVLIRRAILTPTRLEFLPPIALLQSRFTNIADPEFAIRITLHEDNGQSKQMRDKNYKFFKNIFKMKLLDGIKVGHRQYLFLGSSSSQLKENGIMFYATDSRNQSALDIRSKCGDLDQFRRLVAKYIARFGLMFSQAIAHFKYDPANYKVCCTNDFKTLDDKFIFSDGGGMISILLAQKIIQNLKTPPNYSPTAFQIRYGGCKGMLVSYKMPTEAIIFRGSMKKYHCDDNILRILKFSAPRNVYFNRPFINILCQLSVPPQTFYKIFNRNIRTLTGSLFFEKDALDLTLNYRNQNLPYEKLSESGLLMLKEPFLRQIINHLCTHRMDVLKSKNRMILPHNNARTAFGVIDEMKLLNPGEIFFQYTLMNDDGSLTGETVILDNVEVMITKFPCLSLGDVRKFKARNLSSLSHVKDCVVFPAKGDRPHTDEISGSDLDGDEYAILWEIDLIFPGPNHQAMSYKPAQPLTLDHDITFDDIVDFVCDYFIKSNIGVIANSHLMFSDFHPKGLRSDECQIIANEYSVALDFQKSGWRKFKEQAREAFCEYHQLVLEIIEMMDLESEVALISAAYERSESNVLIFDNLFGHFNTKFEKQSTGLNESDRMLLISSWYAICLEMVDRIQFQFQNEPLLGLPFMVPDRLIELANYQKIVLPKDFKNIDRHLLIDHTSLTFKLAIDLIMFWVENINKLLDYDFQLLIILENGTESCILERDLIEQQIKKQLDTKLDLIGSISSDQNDEDEIIFLFNTFILDLFDQCSKVNEIIMYGTLEENLMLRYAPYSLSFYQKLSVGNTGKESCDEHYLMIYTKKLEELFDNLCLKNFCLKSSRQIERFVLIDHHHRDKRSNRLNLKKVDKMFYSKIKLICGGISKMIISDEENHELFNSSTKSSNGSLLLRPSQTEEYEDSNLLLDERVEGYNLRMFNIKYFNFEIEGYTISNNLVKIFLSHPDFYSRIYKKFQIFE
ncbi:RNA-dependent RNA polymerase 1-like protein [Sarcoptes scabiei]|uniref:RNA-dependent RNA polymerase n=1 Tax=Sarcoptes scabiei TaxID=52283 RepID=A0A132AKB4_SARSC|nr:RNA-dependent RNA polymerase 1-like protein [Sarcoptes scabiei]